MTLEFITAFSISITRLYDNKLQKLPILIGRDTRITGNIIQNIIISILNYYGIETVCIGVVPTPVLSSILSEGKYSLGIMITASHDPSENNGIKLFNDFGYKLDVKSESILEYSINSIINNTQIKNHDIQPVKNKKHKYLKNIYIKKIEKHFGDLEINHKILIDCSHGAFYLIAKNALNNYKNIYFINDKPNGININYKCGALEPSNLLKLVKKYNYDYGVAFDGDGDRAVFVSKQYGIIESEKIILLLAKYLNLSLYNKIVSTEICNKGLEINCVDNGFKLFQVKVGDRNVVNKVDSCECIIGAEPSGHFYFPKMSNSMDGLISAMHFFRLLSLYNDQFTDVLKSIVHYDRVYNNVYINCNINESTINKINNLMQTKIDNNNEKLVIRKSMWEPVIRVYYDYINTNNIKVYNKMINDQLNSYK